MCIRDRQKYQVIFFVEKLIEESEKGSVKCEIQAYSIAEALENRIDADVVLLSPLICFEQIKIERLVRCRCV